MTAEDDNKPRPGESSGPGHDIVAPPDAAQHARLPFPVVGIGASAGGIQALEAFFDQVDDDTGMAFVVVQHLSPDHTSMLRDILSRHTKIPVDEIEDGMSVEPNHAYVIAPGFTLSISDGKLRLGEPVEKHGHRRPVDDFFRSLADEQRESAIAVILSGTGTNGTAGCQAIKAAGGICVAQDPETAPFPGMPQSLIHAGHADQVLDPGEIPAVLKRFVSRPYIGPEEKARTDEESLQRDRAHVREILAILRARTRHDFTGYRKPTLLRRIQRRMSLTECETLSEYGSFLRENPDEVTALSNDLMINVTGFFRDREAWEALRTAVVAPLLASRTSDQPLRAWVTACASGEEAYTLAMVIAEEMRGRDRIDVKIFATDTADRSLALARAGIYPAGIEADLTLERLERFFDKDEHTYRVKKEIRDMVVFAPQDVLRDPPFSRVDLCTCRNLLIYLEPETQRRVLALLHFSLRDGGYLFLGNTESYSGSEHLFEIISKRWRIYRRTGSGQHRFAELPSFATRIYEDPARVLEMPGVQSTRPSATLVLQRALLERYGPPTVVVDRSDQVVYFHGATDPFLLHPVGEPTRDLMQMVRPHLRLAACSALRTAMRENQVAVAQSPPGSDGSPQLEISAAPVIEGKSPEYFLVSFRVLQPLDDASKQRDAAAVAYLRDSVARDGDSLDEVRMLRLELQNTTEAFEATNEELKAANEEATSMNEELQSTNEELETSKEELQSVNEELTTVNNQLQAKISQLEATTNDLSNLLGSTDIAVVFLDAEFRVRRFTPAVSDLLELRDTDVGRPVTDLAQKFTDDKLLPDARVVLQKLVPVEREVHSHSGRWYLRRTLPYRTAENHIEGVVITFVDIGARKRAEEEIISSQQRLQAVLEQLQMAVVIVQPPGGRLMFANKKAETLFKHSFKTPIPADSASTFYPNLPGSRPDGTPYRPEEWPLARALTNNEVVHDEEITVQAPDGPQSLLVSASPVSNGRGETIAVVTTFQDVTQRKHGERHLSQVEARFRLLVESARDFAIFYVDHMGRVVTWNAGAERILGWSEKEIIGQPAALMFTPEDRAAFVPEEELRQAAESRRATDERWHVRKDGSRFWASGVMASVTGANGEIEGFVKIMRDQTDRKLAEDRLMAATVAAERAQSAAIEANRAKDHFIAVVSHELRTPLNTIRLWARMLRNENMSQKDRDEGIQMVERAAVAQQQVIDDLFDVSRIASGKLRLAMRETRLADAIRGAVEAVEPVAAARGILFSADVSADIGIVRADPGRIQQVVWNLLSNAVKFTAAGGKVHVAARREGARVVIEVIDTGIGIHADFIEHVFERFRQGDGATTRPYGGLGLGLSIARQLVELHGGTIRATSSGQGKGATFTVDLPLPQSGPEATVTADKATDGSINLKGVDILLVEDEALSRETMRRLFEERGAEVRTVDSVAAAREAVKARAPEILVSDIGLPGEDGYALIRHLRKLKTSKPIIAVAVTAFAREEDRQQVLQSGFDEHFAKPVDADQLVATLAGLVER